MDTTLLSIQTRIARHTPIRRRLIGELFQQLVDEPGNADVAVELAALIEG